MAFTRACWYRRHQAAMTDNGIDDPTATLETEVLDLASRLFDGA